MIDLPAWRRVQPQQIKEIAWVVLGQAGVMIASLLTMKMLTAYLPPAIYAQVNLLMVAMIMPTWLLFAPLTQSCMRWYAQQREKGALGDLLRTTLTAYGLLTMAFVLIVAICLPVAQGQVVAGLKSLWLLWLALFLIEAWNALGLSIAGAARQRGRVALVSVVSAWARLGFTWIIIETWGPSIAGVITGNLCASLLVILYAMNPAISELRGAKHAEFRLPLLTEMLRYGLPFGIWSVFAWVQQYVDRYVLEFLIGGNTAGSYVAALQVVGIPFTISSSLISTFLTPIVYEVVGDGSESQRSHRANRVIGQFVAIFFIFGLCVIVLFGLFGREIMLFMTHHEYLVSRGVIVMIAIGALLNTAAQQLSLVLLAHNRSGLLVWAKTIPAIIGAPIAFELIAKGGLQGASISYFVNGLLFLLAMIMLIQRVRGQMVIAR